MIKKNSNISIISTGSWVPESIDKIAKSQTYKISLDNLILNTSIGIHQHEKKSKQRVSFSISIEVVDNIATVKPEINNFLSYENVINNIKAIIDSGHIDLVETLAYKILTNIFSDKRANFVWLKVEKLDVFKEAKSVGLEIEKTRENFMNLVNAKRIPEFNK